MRTAAVGGIDCVQTFLLRDPLAAVRAVVGAGHHDGRAVRSEHRLRHRQGRVGDLAQVSAVGTDEVHVVAEGALAGVFACRDEGEPRSVRAPGDLSAVELAVGHLARFGTVDVDDEDLLALVDEEPEPVEAVLQPGDAARRFLVRGDLLVLAVAVCFGNACAERDPCRVGRPDRGSGAAGQVGHRVRVAAVGGQQVQLRFAFGFGAQEGEPLAVGGVPRRGVVVAVREFSWRARAVERHRPELAAVLVLIEVRGRGGDHRGAGVGRDGGRAEADEVRNVGRSHAFTLG